MRAHMWVRAGLGTDGVTGYLFKNVAPVEAVSGPRIARQARSSSSRRDELALLARTEKVVADLVARGFNNGEIAGQLVLAEGMIKNHISALLRKFDARDRTVLALRLAKALGLGTGALTRGLGKHVPGV